MTILFCVLSVAAAPATRPSPATTRSAAKTKLKADAPDEVKKLAEYTQANRKKLIDARLMVLKVAQNELNLRTAGQVKPGTPTQKLGGGRGFAVGDGFNVRSGDQSKPRWVFQSQEDKKKHVAKAREELEEAREAVQVARSAVILLPESGSDGSDRGDVEQGWIGHVSGATVKQVIDGQNVIIRLIGLHPLKRMSGASADVWVEGCDTSKMLDGEVVRSDLNIWIKGTKTYEAVSGLAKKTTTRTILKAEVFDLDDYLE
jgi:hypothetical protein